MGVFFSLIYFFLIFSLNNLCLKSSGLLFSVCVESTVIFLGCEAAVLINFVLGHLILLSWSILDIYTSLLRLPCTTEHSWLTESRTVTRNTISTCILDRIWLVLNPKTRFAVSGGVSCCQLCHPKTVFSLCNLITPSHIFGVCCIAFNWSCCSVDFSGLPQPFWILIPSLNSHHLSQAQVWGFFSFPFFFKVVIFLHPSHLLTVQANFAWIGLLGDSKLMVNALEAEQLFNLIYDFLSKMSLRFVMEISCYRKIAESPFPKAWIISFCLWQIPRYHTFIFFIFDWLWFSLKSRMIFYLINRKNGNSAFRFYSEVKNSFSSYNCGLIFSKWT